MIKKSGAGFTLVELLVVIAVMSILGLIVATLFVRTLRGSNKSQIISQIKQNGQAVLETMDKTIRNADNVVCPSIIPPATSASSNTLVFEKAGQYQRFRFVPPQPTLAGLVIRDSASPSAQETDQTLFINRVCNPADPMPQANILTDTHPQKGVSLTNGSFIRNRQPGFKDVITIDFKLGPGILAPPVVAGQIDPVPFQTTIELR